MRGKAACCDYCGKNLDCEISSKLCNNYWMLGTGHYICDECLLSNADDFPEMCEERLIALRLWHVSGISLENIDKAIERAKKLITPHQLQLLAELREEVFKLLADGELVAAMFAGQALFNGASHLQESMTNREDVVTGRRFKGGRKQGAVGPIRKKIAALLKKNPAMKNPELLRKISTAPPKGWAFYSNRAGKYFEGPNNENMDYRTFCNAASKERRLLKE